MSKSTWIWIAVAIVVAIVAVAYVRRRKAAIAAQVVKDRATIDANATVVEQQAPLEKLRYAR